MRSKYHSAALEKQSEDFHESLLYTGPSMRPTLKPMDTLQFSPCVIKNPIWNYKTRVLQNK